MLVFGGTGAVRRIPAILLPLLTPIKRCDMEEQKQPDKNKKPSRLRWYLLGAVLCLLLAAVPGYRAGQYYWGRATLAEAVVVVPTGSDFSGLTDSLQESGALKNPALFDKLARSRELDSTVRPGRYQLQAGMSYAALINMFKSGRQSPVRVTFNNLRSVDRLSGILSRKLEPDSLAFLAALRNDSLVGALGFDSHSLLGLFLPNTYEFYWTTTPEEFMRRMKKEYDRFWTDERSAKLTRSGLNRQQAITLASIVYEETKKTEEMPRVAGVYVNRLRRGMPLQADPTVKYALGDFALRRVLLRHLEVDSPYNTYKYPGLPPGPICMPSIAALESVLDFEEHDYVYFCAKDDLSGAHNFARTLAEHNRNAQAYSRALDRLKIR